MLLILLPVPLLTGAVGGAAGQAESYMDDAGTIWMYYDADSGAGVNVQTSTNGIDFGGEQVTGLTDTSTNTVSPLLTGLSVVKNRFGGYRGYFSNENAPVGEGDVFAATSTDLLTWTMQAASGDATVGSHGEVIGPNSASDIFEACRQPFALKRNDPNHPGCVTLFYYRNWPPPEPNTTSVYYSTSLDGVHFYTENLLDTGTGSVAGPTVVDTRGLDGWPHSATPVYLLYTDAADADNNHIVQAHTLTKVV